MLLLRWTIRAALIVAVLASAVLGTVRTGRAQTREATPVPSATRTGTPTQTLTPSITPTPRPVTPTRTPSITRTPTITRTPSPTRTNLTPPTAGPSPTPSPTRSATPLPTPTRDETPTPIPTATLVPGPDTYTVLRGDTLASIAAKFGVRLGDLLTVNNLTIESQIFPGQILRIPPRPPTPTFPPLTVPAGYTTYIVQVNDQLLLIARRFRVTVPALRTANNLSSDTIYPGQVLLIPPPNTPTVTRTPYPPNATLYVVQAGDQLLRIARKYGLSLTQLRSANGLTSDTIRPGQVLFIPTRQPSSTPRPPTATPTGVYVPYVVKPGDRLQRIAVWYGVTMSSIRAANGLSGDTIRVGQTLTIPNPTRYPLRYVVQPSDNLTRIAARFETTVEALQIANAMGDSTTIYEGLILIVPAKP